LNLLNNQLMNNPETVMMAKLIIIKARLL
jgi:hypothetical protein